MACRHGVVTLARPWLVIADDLALEPKQFQPSTYQSTPLVPLFGLLCRHELRDFQAARPVQEVRNPIDRMPARTRKHRGQLGPANDDRPAFGPPLSQGMNKAI